MRRIVSVKMRMPGVGMTGMGMAVVRMRMGVIVPAGGVNASVRQRTQQSAEQGCGSQRRSEGFLKPAEHAAGL